MADYQARRPDAAATEEAKAQSAVSTPAGTRKRAVRKRLFGLLAIGVVGAAIFYWLYYALVASHFVSTEDAYVGADVAKVTPLVSGPVKNVRVTETQMVRAGDVLVEIDPEDATLAVTRAAAEYKRAVSAAGLDPRHFAGNRLPVARARDMADSNPAVAAARAALNISQLDLERTIIRAPIDGVVTRRQVQVGQWVGAGTTLMTLVPAGHVYVDANFKETQLRKVRAGQCVTLWSDLYGSGVTYHGKVVGLSGGTGAAFALIPAQNATGNWIKVIQRLPVRVQLRPDELARHPLRVGLSMEARIDLSCMGSSAK